MKTVNKVYFKFMNTDEYGYYRLWQNGNILRFPGQPKFIAQALVQKFWHAKWQQVFEDFMAGMEELSKLVIPNNRKDPPAWFVLYLKNRDADKSYQRRDNQDVYNWEEEY